MTQIDLLHLGRPHVIAVSLLAGPEPALVDCGPVTCLDALLQGLQEAGAELTDLRHLLITHIHPDHCGAAGALVARHPGLHVHVHEIGAPHLVDPERLEASARRVYKDSFDRMFGPIAPVPAGNVHVLAGRVLDLDVIPAPGHAPHHVAFLGPDGICHAGDAAGILVPGAQFVYPASAPPGIDVDGWFATLDRLAEHHPSQLRIAHFGEIGDPLAHLDRMREQLALYSGRVRDGWTVEQFVAAAEEELAREDAEVAECYRHQPGFDLSYEGLSRYWQKQREREGGL